MPRKKQPIAIVNIPSIYLYNKITHEPPLVILDLQQVVSAFVFIYYKTIPRTRKFGYSNPNRDRPKSLKR